MSIELTGKCATCKKPVHEYECIYVCSKCGDLFCSNDCRKEHKHGSPKLVIPWENENEAIDNEGDKVIDALKDIIEIERENGPVLQEAGRVRCIICKRDRAVVNEYDRYCVCGDCYKNLRTEFLRKLGYTRENSDEFVEGYRIVPFPNSLPVDPKRLVTLLLTKRNCEKRQRIHVGFQTPRRKGNKVFRLYDLRFWEVPEVVILYIDEKTFEFTPGAYVIVKDD